MRILKFGRNAVVESTNVHDLGGTQSNGDVPGACDLLAVRGGKRKKPQDLALIPPKGRKVELGELSDLSAVAFLDKWFPSSYFTFLFICYYKLLRKDFFSSLN